MFTPGGRAPSCGAGSPARRRPRPPRDAVAAPSGRPVHSGPSRSRRGGRDARARRGRFARSASWSTSGSPSGTGRSSRRASGCPPTPTTDPVPAILEAVPYRLSDGMVTRDVLIHPYWAARGYACVRVDLRGSGESDGVLEDEYHPQEQEDLLEVIAWIAAQPWCSGGVGMTGISWGGFNSLQLAARRPPALKAIITLMSTDDRYADDVHYKGGCVLATDLLHWSTCMLHWQCQPPHEAAVGERWRELWEQRLATNRALDHDLARAPAPGRLLEARLGLRGLRGDRDPGLRRRRLDRRLHQQRPAPAGGAARAAQGADRPVAARVPALRHAGTGDRLPAGGAALVGPLAQGRGHRRHGRADAARLDAGVRAAGALDGRGAGALGRRGRVAVAARRAPAPAARRGRGAARRGR